MQKFWRFARMLLHYRGLLLLALLGVLLDAACVAGGYGTLGFVIDQLFNAGESKTMHTIVAEQVGQLQDKRGIDLGVLVEIVPEGPIAGLAFALGVILLLAIIGSAGRFLHEASTITASMRTLARIRKMVFMRLVHLPLLTAMNAGTAESVSKIVRDTRMLAAGFSAITSRAVRSITVGAVLLLMALYQDWMLVLAFVVVIPPIAILIRKFGKRIRKAAKRSLKQFGFMMSALTESLQGLRVVKVHHAEGYERRRFNRLNRRLLDATLRARTIKALSPPVIETMSMAGVMLVVMVAAWMMYELEREASDLARVMMYLVASAGAFRAMAGMNTTLNEAAAAAESIHEMLQLPVESTPKHEAARNLHRLPRHRESIEFDAVTFRYPHGDSPALRNISLKVQYGTTCAIVGGNGSGKSTLLGLLPRLYAPDAGRVLIDGHPIADCTLRSVRGQMAMVTQETVLFDGTVSENIRYGARMVRREQMIEAAKGAHAHEFISALPRGYDTPLGERGQRLSGGQRQRIAIARAILRNPAILILDEATSQIDADSESKITHALEELRRGRTTFVIAHRLSTVVDADMIVVMAEGEISTIGRHRELLQTSDVYQVLCRTQLHGLEPRPSAPQA